MTVSSLPPIVSSKSFLNRLYATCSMGVAAESAAVSPHRYTTRCEGNTCNYDEENKKCNRRMAIVGIGALTAVNSFSASPLLAQGKPEDYQIFVDKRDGYSYSYPSDWRGFDFLGHDSAFKDRYLQLQNVRLSFIPTNKTDIHDLGTSMEEIVENLTSNVYSAPNQFATILGIQEKSIDGRSYCTFEYILTSPNFKRAAFATIAIGNGRYYTLIVGANERRWRRVRNQLKVVADSFKVLDI
ncbi:psbP-like protein 2, chloroplastic-like [Dorcoceras hygrometricum]|uniref:PsbP-like protein 2, chloroplastic-like n=1 Tax=Dorcoceras hygrometricum TaxID=472368 RepID=A0A2Z7AS36_9LAMI|nr:psbP-like protein 2, chloroplastic-like [Dorcoceras hygrometricum]